METLDQLVRGYDKGITVRYDRLRHVWIASRTGMWLRGEGATMEEAIGDLETKLSERG